MNTTEIIQLEVKNGLSDFGLNDEERRDYENLIQEHIKDTNFEKEEDLINDVKTRVQSFVPSVKLLQKSRTKLQQEKSDLQKKIEEYTKNNPTTTEPPKNEPKVEPMPDWAKALLEEVGNIKKDREAEKQAKIINDKKEAVLTALKPKYNKSHHSMIDVLAKGVDWGTDSAENEFKELLSSLAKDNPAMLADSKKNSGKGEENILMRGATSKTDDKASQLMEDFKKTWI